MLRLFSPIILIQLYLNATFCLFLIYPKSWHIGSLVKLSAFVLLQHVCILLGYWMAVRRIRPKLELWPYYLRLGKVLCCVSIFMNLVFAPFLYSHLTGGNTTFTQGLASVGEAYRARQMYIKEEVEVNPAIQIHTLFYVFTLFMVPVGVVLWHKSGKRFKIFFLVGCLSQVAVWGAAGTMKGIGDIIIFALAGLLLSKHLLSNAKRSDGITGRAKRLHSYLAGATAVMVGFLLFSWMQADRLEAYGKYGDYADALFPSRATGSFAEKMVVGGFLASSYATHGYEGLCGCLELPFVWTRGLGSSVAINSYWEQYVQDGGGMLQDNYLFRNELETGYPALMTWSTVYPWLASDLSFPGVAILMLLIGALTAKLWIDCLETLNPFAILLFSELLLFFAFAPCNNQLIQSRGPLWGLIGSILLYAYDRIKRRPAIQCAVRRGISIRKLRQKRDQITKSRQTTIREVRKDPI